MNNNENDDNIEDISESKINEEDDIKSNINEGDNLIGWNVINISDLSNEEENNLNEDGSDKLEHNNITEYNNNLLELYEKITNNLDKLNIEDRDYEPNKNLRERVKNKIIIKNEEKNLKTTNSNNSIIQKARKRKTEYMEDEENEYKKYESSQKRGKLYTL